MAFVVVRAGVAGRLEVDPEHDLPDPATRIERHVDVLIC